MTNKTTPAPTTDKVDDAPSDKPFSNGTPHVLQCINAIQADLSKKGIAKDKTTTGGSKFNFRGIDDIYNALSPLMARHGLVVMPRYYDIKKEVRQSSKGNALYHITLTGEFTFLSAIDGSSHTCTMYGEAMDSGDKGINKAMSIAYKYACFQVFAIPTVGDNDPDAYVHDELPYQQAVHKLPPIDVSQLHNVEYPSEQVNHTAPDGKLYTDDTCAVRIFNQEEFTKLVRSVMSGEFPLSKFKSPKYLFGNEQIDILQRLEGY